MGKKLGYVWATMLGVGYFPFASGTAGSLATIPLAFVLAYYWGSVGIVAGVLIVFFTGVFATKEVLKYTKHDPSIIVIDETAGQLLSFIFVADYLQNNMYSHVIWLYAIGFGLFRFFDITKPQPARWADSKVLNAWGVMLDDVFAGLYAAVALFVIKKFLLF